MDENLEQHIEENTPQEPSAVEQKAMEMGWRPKEEFSGDETDFIPADEFVRRKPLFDKIESQSKQIKSVHKALEALKTHFSTVRESEYQRALKELKSSRRDALANGDADKFEELDDEIKKVEQEARDLKETDIAPIEQEKQVHPEFASWINRNPWYDSSPHMRVFADDVGKRLSARGMEPREVLKEVEKAVREEFPNKFRNPNKDLAPNVEGSSSSARKSEDKFDLTEQERKIMNTLVGQGVLTKDEYIKQLKQAKGMK